MITIENILKVNALLLTWQSNQKRNQRYFVGTITKKDNSFSFQYLVNTEDYNQAIEQGFNGYPAFKLGDKIYSNNIMSTFTKRLPPKSRKDFSMYLE